MKAEGDRLEVDDPVLVVETDKAAIEVPSPVAGILGRIVARPEEEVPVGQVIAYIAQNEADLAAIPTGPPATAARPPRVGTRRGHRRHRPTCRTHDRRRRPANTIG